jgi:uncharacterized protein
MGWFDRTIIMQTSPAKKILRITRDLTLGLVIGLALMTLYLSVTQERQMFPAQRIADDYRYDIPLPYDEWRVVTPDGVSLHSVRIKTVAGLAKGVVLYFHGNGGNSSDWIFAAKPYLDLGYDVVVTDYRGYGKSTGDIRSERNFHDDADAVYARVIQDYAPERVVLVGRSLGSGIAARLATKVRAKVLILETPYLSMQKVVSNRLPFLPVDLLMRYPLKTEEIIGQIAMPMFLIHGSADDLVPFAHSEALLSLSGGKAKLFRIEGAGHGSFVETPAYAAALASILGGGE